MLLTRLSYESDLAGPSRLLKEEKASAHLPKRDLSSDVEFGFDRRPAVRELGQFLPERIGVSETMSLNGHRPINDNSHYDGRRLGSACRKSSKKRA